MSQESNKRNETKPPRFNNRPGGGEDPQAPKKGPRFSIYWVYAIIFAVLIGFQLFGPLTPNMAKTNELELKNRSISEHKEFLKEKQEEGFSLEQARANYFTFQVVEYLEFLEQAMVMARHSLKFMESTSDKMNGILKETVNKIEQAMKELEQVAE